MNITPLKLILTLLALLIATGCSAVEETVKISGAAANDLSATQTPIRPPSPEPAATATTAATLTVALATSTPTATPTPALFSSPTARPQAERQEAGEPGQISHVVIISIDGLRPDALAIADTPNLDALRLAGAYSPAARAVVPSVTLINHASMLGGMSPKKHGITWNVNDPELGQVAGPTLFSVAHQAGLRSAMVVGKLKLEHLVIPDSVDAFIHAGYTDIQVAGEAVDIIQAALPDVLFIHLPDVDSAGHLTGWMSAGQLLALSFTDGAVGEIVAALEQDGHLEDTLLIVTSDHGGSGRSHGTEAPEDTTIPWLAVGPGVPPGITLTEPITIYDTAATALYALDLPIPDMWDGQPVLEIFD